MPTKRLSRRTFLRGALTTGATITIPLPVLDIMLNGNGTAYASGTAIPRRYCTWFFGNGILPPLWNPAATGSGDAWSISQELMPLASYKNWLTVVSGLSNKIGNASPHPMGSAASTTGASVAEQLGHGGVDRSDRGRREQGRQLPVAGGRVQQRHAQRPRKYAAHVFAPRARTRPNYPEFDPHAFFTRVFTGASTNTNAAQLMKLNQEKKSILDAVLADGNESPPSWARGTRRASPATWTPSGRSRPSSRRCRR